MSSSGLGTLSKLIDDTLIRILIRLETESVKDLLTLELVCKRFRELAQNREVWYPWLQKLSREELLCIDPHEIREKSDIRQIVIHSLKTSKNWRTSSTTIKRRLQIATRTDDYLRTLPGGRYILSSSHTSIICMDVLQDENEDCVVFRYDLAQDTQMTIRKIGCDMADGDTLFLAVVLDYEAGWQKCLFIKVSLSSREYVILQGTDLPENMLALPKNWEVDGVNVDQDMVCLHIVEGGNWEARQSRAIFIIDVGSMSGLLLSPSRYHMPTQITLSNDHTHLVLLMEVPAIISLPMASLSNLWQEWQPDGNWTSQEIQYTICDQTYDLSQASHLLRPGQTGLSSLIMSEMEGVVRGRFLARYLRAHKPTWFDKSISESAGLKEPFVLTILDVRIYSSVSNRFTRYTLHFTVDAEGARFSDAGKYSSFSNAIPSELLGPMSRQGYFIGFQNYFPAACKISSSGITNNNSKLDIDLRKTRSWDVDYYSSAVSYISKEEELYICYCRSD